MYTNAIDYMMKQSNKNNNLPSTGTPFLSNLNQKANIRYSSINPPSTHHSINVTSINNRQQSISPSLNITELYK